MNSLTTADLPGAYSRRAVWLHWLTAGLILLQWVLGRELDWFHAGPPRVFARSFHMLVGLVVLAFILERVWRRLRHPVAHAAGGPPIANRAAIAVHWALYLLVVFVILVGVVLVWVRGDQVFGLFKVPAFDPKHREYRRMVGDFHGLVANVILAVAGCHALAALVHEGVWRDGVLARMVPLLRRA
ncbi:MAG TPA: cytochrome b/b6 domain-containing protein [Caulobacteraceae bacterium]